MSVVANGAELKEYRQKILTSVLNQKTICELILDRTIPIITSDIQDELTKDHIYDYAFLPEVQELEKTYIAFELGGRKPDKRSLYINVKINFYIFSHHGVIRHSTGYLRTDLLSEEIQELFNKNINFEFGKMFCTENIPLKVGTSCYGRQLTFEVAEQSIGGCK